jgi:hypothetical protein
VALQTHLSFTVRPEVDAQPDNLVDGGIGALVDERGGEGRHWEESEARFEAPMEAGAGEETQRPLPSQENEAEDEIDCLEDRDRFDSRI